MKNLQWSVWYYLSASKHNTTGWFHDSDWENKEDADHRAEDFVKGEVWAYEEDL